MNISRTAQRVTLIRSVSLLFLFRESSESFPLESILLGNDVVMTTADDATKQRNKT